MWAKLIEYLSVEDPLTQVNEIVIAEEEVEVFQCFSEEEWLLNIIFVAPNLDSKRL